MIGFDPASLSPPDVQATFCATLVDEWIRLGVGHAVVAPGSRSTPMAIALSDRRELAVHVVHDERCAAFVALGLGLDGVPALLLCTSGTAAANFFPAVVEAALSELPLIVITADRPEELRGVGAPQTIDQIELYGRHVRWFHDPGVPSADTAPSWRSIAADAVRFAADGPIQLNLPFREPLLGSPGPLPAATAPRPVVPDPPPQSATPVVASHPRGLVLVGGRSGVDATDIARLSQRTGWPILADPLSQMRHIGHVTHAESMLRSPELAASVRPSVVVRVGRPATSKTLAQWVDRCVAEHGTRLFQVGGPGRIDPGRNVSTTCTIEEMLAAEHGPPDDAWRSSWMAAEDAAAAVIADAMHSAADLTEPAVARTVADHLPDDAQLVVASSMPVRDLEWFGGPRARAYCNRGANGIDGVSSTGLGVALSGRTTVVLIGDLAFTHDINALTGLAARDVDLRIVVVDNDGGGIFSFLPQAAALEHDRFEQLFGTPLGVDVTALAAAHGVTTTVVRTAPELARWLSTPGPWVVRVPSNRATNVDVHAAVHAAVVTAVDPNLPADRIRAGSAR